MRFTTIAVILLSSSLVSAQRGNGRGNRNGLGSSNGKSPVHANPDVVPKIETLEAKVIPGQDQKAEDADGNKENNGNSYAYGQEKKPEDADGGKEYNGNSYAYGQREKTDDTATIKGQEVAELEKIDADIQEFEALEETEFKNRGQEMKSLRGGTAVPRGQGMPSGTSSPSEGSLSGVGGFAAGNSSGSRSIPSGTSATSEDDDEPKLKRDDNGQPIKPEMPSVPLHAAGHHKAMAKYVKEMELYESAVAATP